MTAAGDARRDRPARRGETEVLTLRLTCCERTWVGPDRAHCCRRHRGCGHVFDDPDLWDDHRRSGRCLDPLALGLTQTATGVWVRALDNPH